VVKELDLFNHPVVKIGSYDRLLVVRVIDGFLVDPEELDRYSKKSVYVAAWNAWL
jgi:hypothetical protein